MKVGIIFLVPIWACQRTTCKRPLQRSHEESDVGLGNTTLMPQNIPMQSTHDKVSMKELLKASIEFAERGGDVLVKIRNGEDIGQRSKGTHDDVGGDDIGKDDPFSIVSPYGTIWDPFIETESHKRMTFAFKKFFTGIHVVSEEHTENPDMDSVPAPSLRNREVDRIITDDEFVNADEITVWIDPLDATQEYTEDLRQYATTMVCIVRGNQPIAAVIHKPFEKSSAWAWVGHGTNLVDESAKAKPNSIIVSRTHAGGVNDLAKARLGDNVTVIPAGGAGYMAWALFDGTAEAYVHTTLIKKWQICPGNAILRHSGGKMTRLNGEKINYKYDTDARIRYGMIASLHKYHKYQKALSGAFGV